MAEAPVIEEGDHGLVTATLSYVARHLVDYPDEVQVDAEPAEEGLVVFRIRVHSDDLGRVIGKQGHTARALRQVARAAGTRARVRTRVEIVQ